MIPLYIFVLILSTFISLGFILFVIVQIIAVFTTDAPFVPIPNGLEDEIVENLGLNPTSVLYDLGCGDGRVLIKALEKHPEIKAVGVEIAFLPYLLAKFYTRKHENIEIKRENLFKTDIAPATHIFVYLYPRVINQLILNIREKCKTGTILMSCDFEIEKISQNKVIETRITDSKRGRKLFIYII